MKTTFFGLSHFKNSMMMQEHACRLVEQSGFPVVMGFEYYPVVTGQAETLLGDEFAEIRLDLKVRGFEIVDTELNRGSASKTGPVFYSPGQLVIYPLVPIEKLKISEADFAKLLMEATSQWLQKYKIYSETSKNGGLVTSAGKIAELDFRIEQGIACGGLSIHISNDLALVASVTGLDSLAQQGVNIELKQAFDEWNLYFTSSLLKAIPGGVV